MKISLAILIGAAASVCSIPTQAQEAYLRGGLPGIGLGYTHSINSNWNLRGEFSTLGNRSMTGNREGVDFDAELKADQYGIYGDWFPSASSFRLTGGVSSNNVKFTGNALPAANGTITINNTSVPFGTGDSFAVEVKLPSVTPYIGIGWGHRADTKGWAFIADVGAYLGKFKATSTASPSVINRLNAAGVDAQAEINSQTRKVQDSLDKFSVLPMLTIGVSYRW